MTGNSNQNIKISKPMNADTEINIKNKKEIKEEFVNKILDLENNIKLLQTNYEFKVENYESLMNVYNTKIKVCYYI